MSSLHRCLTDAHTLQARNFVATFVQRIASVTRVFLQCYLVTEFVLLTLVDVFV